jgi:hypothetical protein
LDDQQLAELIKALLRLSNAVNDLSQDLLELPGAGEGAVFDKDIAQAAHLLRAAVQALDAALELHNAAHTQMKTKEMMAADAHRASDGSTSAPTIERQPDQSIRRKKF